MEKEQRNRLQKATQDARKLLEEEFSSQLLQTYDIEVEKVRWAEEAGAHLQAEQRLIRERLVAWIEHKEAQINDRKEALLLALREMAFTALNRFVALKLMEARELVRPCVSGGMESAGFLEFTAVAQGLLADQESSYQLYLETIFEDVSRELRTLFDPRDPASLLWPRRAALLELLDILNRPGLAELWIEDETLGWVYQHFNGDDVKQMRDAANGGAPRNSRELAVRNQFFTPRYVVEFLTDNTLGRIWYEMRQGKTVLKDRCRYLVRRTNEIWLQPGVKPPAQPNNDEALNQEELLHQPVHIPYRPLKDPREIRMLDPACESMHFGLYAFDLYLAIYKEAWEIAQGSDEQSTQEEAFSPFATYTAGFADKSAFLRDVPQLILQNNIHGIDIDPRATQIARLTLWLRAQRAWKEEQLQVADRPPINRSNVVCAEPMPGEQGLLEDFVNQEFSGHERSIFLRLLIRIFEKMRHAGEEGSLLRIERDIQEIIGEVQKEWQELSAYQPEIFSISNQSPDANPSRSPRAILFGLEETFWDNIEERVYSALSSYAHKGQLSSGYQNKLFAEDAAIGFAFIGLCRKKYDAILMNPPFGDHCASSLTLHSRTAESLSSNLLCDFFRRAYELTTSTPAIGSIYDRTVAIKSTYEDFRRSDLLEGSRLFAQADLGWGVLDANVEVTSSVLLGKGNQGHSCIFADLRQADAQIKGQQLQEIVKDLSIGRKNANASAEKAEGFLRLPNAVLGYTFPAFARRSFKILPGLSESGATFFEGHTIKSEVFFRYWWEIPLDDAFRPTSSWQRLYNGGDYQRYISPLCEAVKYGENGELVAAHPSTVLRNLELQKKGVIGFGKRGEFLDAHVVPNGFVSTVEGKHVLLDDNANPYALLALLNSKLFQSVINLYCGQHKYPGYVGMFPCVGIEEGGPLQRAAEACQEIFESRFSSQATEEVSPIFTVDKDSPLINIREAGAGNEGITSIARLECHLNEEIFDAYGLSLEEREWVHKQCENEPLIGGWWASDAASEEINRLRISFLVGCVFGRWDATSAVNKQFSKPESYFDPLPACPPAMLKRDDNLSLRPVFSKQLNCEGFPVFIRFGGIIVADPSHVDDISGCAKQVAEFFWGDQVNDVLHSTCESIGVKSLGEWFASPVNFFSHHLRLYSKGRRQAPIYWQISTGGSSYSIWLYYCCITQDTIYRVLRDFVGPRLEQAERVQLLLESRGVLSADSATGLQEAQALLQDLRLLKKELDLVAPLWNPNLNDGVIINHAILWRITPYAPWQKKCKECWDKLVKGDYDWAHLAFYLWPERVIPKCTTDRSLAIAHGLEERLWQETNNGNWLPRQLSDADLQALIAEHSNREVKSALQRFLAAPPPVAPTRTRAPRATRSTASGTTRKPRGSTAVVDAEATRQVLLVLTAAPAEGLSRNAIAELLGAEAASLTAVIKQLKATDQIEQLGAARAARYVLTEKGRAAVASQAGEDD
jgi:hypothetical protein